MSDQPFLPRTPQEMIDFIGSHFEMHQFADAEGNPLPLDMNRFTLTVHDLLSAFQWAGWYDDDEEDDKAEHGEPWTEEQIASVRAWAKEYEEESILRRADEIKAERAALPKPPQEQDR